MSAVRPSSDVEIKGLVEDWAPVSGTFSSRKLLSFRETEACDARYVTIAGICTAQPGKLSTDEADDMSQTHLIWRRVQTGPGKEAPGVRGPYRATTSFSATAVHITAYISVDRDSAYRPVGSVHQ